MKKRYLIPPSPQVMATLHEEYCSCGHTDELTFHQFLVAKGFVSRAQEHAGMDDGAVFGVAGNDASLISVPRHAIQGRMRVKVLLIDFADQTSTLPVSHYENLLFSKATHPTGSMRDYYHEVSLAKVDVTGSVHGWFRMPQTYAYYTNGQSGVGPEQGSAYPRDARRMAEDAVRVALDNGVTFQPDLDLTNEGVITALFIVHAGRGAEELHPSIGKDHIWSHKWNMVNPVNVGNNMWASIYLTVPNDARVGVCAHELGHLAFQWEDFYDPNYAQDGKAWDGSGDWDLMAGGSYNGQSLKPAHPMALHKAQHRWIEAPEVRTSSRLTLGPFTATAGKTFKLISSRYMSGQYLLLENRTRFGFDSHLPGEGLLVWRVDESKQMFAPQRPALLLVQADGRHELERVGDRNAGDSGDPFPGSSGRTELSETGNISTTFPEADDSGITLKNIQRNVNTGTITLDVLFDGVEPPTEPPVEPPAQPDVVTGEVEPNLNIPDNDPAGVRSTIRLEAPGAVRQIAVAVDIRHTYIQDLSVELISPSGQRAILHNSEGGSADDLVKTYRSSSVASLAAPSHSSVAGDWVLRVVDLAGADTGVLRKWSVAIDVDQNDRFIYVERTANLKIPDNDPSGIFDVITVARAGIVRSMQVEVDINHTFRRDLRVELLSPGGDRAMLHNRTGGSADDLKQTYVSAQTPGMAGLIGKPVRGQWALRVSDLAGADIGTLNQWSLRLELAPDQQVFEREVAPALVIPDKAPAGVGSAIAVPDAGTAQSIQVKAAIEHSYIGDLRVELVAPSGERALLHNRTGGRTKDLSLDFDSASSAVLSDLVGLPISGNWILRVMDLEREDVGRLNWWWLRITYVR